MLAVNPVEKMFVVVDENKALLDKCKVHVVKRIVAVNCWRSSQKIPAID